MSYQFSTALARMNGTATRDIFKLLSRPEIISFAGGLPATDCLPVAQVGEITAEIFADTQLAVKLLQYGTTEGFPGLREQIIPLIGDVGIEGVTVDELLVISGGTQGLDLLCKAFLDPGDVVLVEDPTFLGFLQTILSYNGKALGVRPGPEGLDLADLEQKIKQHKPKLLYCIPNFSNPTGKTYTAKNRKAIVELAAKYNLMIIEDDPYGRLRFSGEAQPSLKSFDTTGTVVYVSSFSKTVSPGLRVGFAVGNRDVIRKMAIGKQGTDLHTSSLAQVVIKKYLEKGYFYPNVEKSLPMYRQRKTAMIDALTKYMPAEFKHTDPEGGLFIWGEFDAPVNTVAIFPEAIEKNAAYINGTVFFADAGGSNTLRLNYSNESPERIDAGIKVLGDLFKQKIAGRV
ncbi:aminotransferase [Betaproteobacteria bacterium]|nr:aminotransferase [Betaproteobacteria bacterium]